MLHNGEVVSVKSRLQLVKEQAKLDFYVLLALGIPVAEYIVFHHFLE
jgi:hypothetical protein